MSTCMCVHIGTRVMFGCILVSSALADKGGAGWGKRGTGEGGKGGREEGRKGGKGEGGRGEGGLLCPGRQGGGPGRQGEGASGSDCGCIDEQGGIFRFMVARPGFLCLRCRGRAMSPGAVHAHSGLRWPTHLPRVLQRHGNRMARMSVHHLFQCTRHSNDEFIPRNYRTITEQFVSRRAFAKPDSRNNSEQLRNNSFGVGFLEISALNSLKKKNHLSSFNANEVKFREALRQTNCSVIVP